ncbi:hypothetical protein QU39_00270, partial [Staphylococcus aureus]
LRAFRPAHRDALAHQDTHHVRGAFVIRHFGGAVGERADDSRAVDRELAPGSGDEIGRGPRVDRRVGEQCDQGLARFAFGHMDRAVAALDDAAGGMALGGQVDDHGHGALRRHFGKAVALLDAVLDHGEPRGGSHQPGQPGSGSRAVIGLG